MPIDTSDLTNVFDPGWKPPKQNSGISAEVESAIRSYGAGFGHIAGALGSDAARDWALRQDELSEEAAARSGWTQRFSDIDGVGSAAKYVGHLAVQSLPYIAETGVAAATGGGSAAARGVGQLGLRALGREATEGAIKGAGRTAAGVIGSIPSSMGQLLDAQQQESGTYNLPTAAAESVPYAALNAFGLEGAIARRSLGGAATGSVLRRTAGGLVKTGVSEGASEMGQQVLEEGARASVNPNYSPSDPAVAERLLESGVGGFVLGGITGGIHGAARRRREEPAVSRPVDPAKPTDILHPEPVDTSYVDLAHERTTAEPSVTGYYENPTDAVRDPYAGMRGEDGTALPPGGVRLGQADPWTSSDPYAGMRGEAVAPVGAQANLFGEPAIPAREQQTTPQVEPQAAAEGQGDLFQSAPSATVGTDFSLRDMRQRILAATGAHWGDAPQEKRAAGPFEFQVALKISRLLGEGKADQAASFLASENEKLQSANLTPKTIEVRLAVLNAAQQAVQDYAHRFEDARRQEQALAVEQAKQKAQPGVVVDKVGSVDNAASAEAVREQAAGKAEQIEPVKTAAEAQPAVNAPDDVNAVVANEARERVTRERGDILQRVLDDPETRNPVGRFRSELKKAGFKTLALTDAEAAKIERHEQLREAFSDEIHSGPNEMDVEALVPERKAPQQPQAKKVGQLQQARAAALDEADQVRRKVGGAKANRIMDMAMRAFANNDLDVDALRAVSELVSRRKLGLAEMMVKPLADRLEKAPERDQPLIRPAEAAVAASQREPVIAEQPKEKPKRERKAKPAAEKPAANPAPEPVKPATPEPAAPQPSRRASGPTITTAAERVARMQRLAERHTEAMKRGDKASAKIAADAIADEVRKLRDEAAPQAEQAATETPAPAEPDEQLDPEQQVRQNIRDAWTSKQIDGDKSTFLRRLLKEDGPEAAQRQLDEYLRTRSGVKVGDTITKLERMPAMGRRALLRSGAAFAVFRLGNKVFSQTFSSVDRMRLGDLPGALRAIQNDSANPVYRELARRLIPLITDVQLRTYEVGKIYKYGVPGDLNDSYGVTTYNRKTGETVISLRHDENPNGFTGTNDRTLLHEALHAAILSRYSDIAKVGIKGAIDPSTVRNKSDQAIVDLFKLRLRLKEYVDRTEGVERVKKESGGRIWLSEALSDFDEFISWGLTEPKFQEWMKQNNAGLASRVWNAFKDGIKKFLGRSDDGGPKGYLDELLDAGYSLLDNLRDVPADSFMKREKLASADPDIRTHSERIGDITTSEGLSNLVGSQKDFISDLIGKGRRIKLSSMFLEHLVDHYADKLPALRDYVQSAFKMGARVNEMMTSADQLVKRWDALPDKAQREEVGSLMLDSTVNQTRPDRDAGHESNTLAKDGAHGQLQARYQALSDDAKAVYSEVMDGFEDKYAAMQELAHRTVDSSGLAESDKSAMNKEITALFKRNKVYFPLSRFGDHIVISRSAAYDRAAAQAETARAALDNLPDDASTDERKSARQAMADAVGAQKRIGLEEGGYTVQAFESEAQARRAAVEAQQAGLNVTQRLAHEHLQGVDVVPSSFMTKLNEVLDTEAGSGGPRAEIATNLKSLMGQLYLQSLPENSALKRGIGRKTIAGYSQDARRVFAKAAERDAHLIARLELAEDSRKALEDMQQQAKDVDKSIQDDDPARPKTYQEVAEEVMKRHAATLKITNNPIQTKLAHLAYVWYLGFTPSFAITNMAQTPLVTLPMMAARHGWGRSSEALFKAAGEVGAAQAKAWRNDGRFGEIKIEDLTKDAGEQAALRELVNSGIIDLTQEHDLGTIASGESQGWRQFMRYASYFPHYTEKFNRLTTALAAYRMAIGEKQRGYSSRLDPVAYAAKMVSDSHFNYAGANAPRFMMPGAFPLAKIMFQFRKWQMAMGYALVNNFHQAVKGASPEERRIARKTLTGMLLTHGLAAGTMGLPGASVAFALANMAHSLFGDDDEPWDAQAAYRGFLTDVMGGLTDDPELKKAWGEVLAHGALRAPGVREALPGDLSSRVGLQDVFSPLRTRNKNATGRDSWNQYLAGLFGPAGSIGGDAAEAMKQFGLGEARKAWELLTPKALRDVMKGARFADEGVTSARGNTIIPSEQISTGELLSQMMGFTPPNIAESYEQRAAIQDAKTEIQGRRNRLLKVYAEAAVAGDKDAMAEAREDIQAFNQVRASHHEPIINGSAMLRSIQEHRQFQRQLVNGVRLRPKERAMANYGDFGNVR